MSGHARSLLLCGIHSNCSLTIWYMCMHSGYSLPPDFLFSPSQPCQFPLSYRSIPHIYIFSFVLGSNVLNQKCLCNPVFVTIC